MKRHASFENLLKKGLSTTTALVVLFSVSACNKPEQNSPDAVIRAEFCKPVRASKEFEETPFVGESAVIHSFQNTRALVNSACGSCHMSPAKTGGFSYLDSLQGAEVLLEGKRVWINGFQESAPKMRDLIFHPDAKKRMPPTDRREKNPTAFTNIGTELDLWIKAGNPVGTFKAGQTSVVQRGKYRPVKPVVTSEIGDCIPTAKAIGFDYRTDRLFELAQTLPKYLSETDLTTLDPFTLAKQGTLAYNVEYPLWADNAEKGRWIHVPMAMINGQLTKQSISYDEVKHLFNIPENTRFYKTFYRAITLPNKRIRMRRMETRIIVSRTPWQKSLFGTYQWDDKEQVATLVEAPYRDGTAWKDVLEDVIVDETKSTVRPYAIPGRQRCIDCHMGSSSRNFVLGFQPLQINKRAVGEGGRIDIPLESDLDQVQRFISYGLLTGIRSSADLPVLENAGNSRPRNEYELRANGYTVGNCAHCHNPDGLAFTKENGINLALGAGELFQFNTQRKSVEQLTRRLVHQNGELDGSQIWRKVADKPSEQGMFSQMPMHTPGSPDCRLLTVMGKWIRSFESMAAADDFQPECKKQNAFFWIDLDFTWANSDVYTPRRNDWKDTQGGMPEKYRQLELAPELKAAIQTEYPVGYWLKKPQCKFPVVDLPLDQRRPWMMRGSLPKRPFGEVYSTTPGSYFFRTTCMKCHGPLANGDSSLARGILNWSGGSVRVANLAEGLFGKKGENLKTFDLSGKNYAGNYLIWMAMEGTRVRFPPEISSYMGKHGGQMLNGIRDKCRAQIASEKPSSPQFMDHEIFHRVCFMNNLYPGHPDLAFDPVSGDFIHPDRVEEWLDRAAWNAGWAIFDFLKEASGGHWRVSNDQCELVYKNPDFNSRSVK